MSQLSDLEAAKVDRLKDVALRDQILRLIKTPDFRAVFEQEFMEAEAGRLVRAAGDPMLGEKERNDCLQMALATGHVKRFLNAKLAMGNTAETDIKQIDDLLEEIRMHGEDDTDGE